MKDIRIYGIHHIGNAVELYPGDFGLVSILAPEDPTPGFIEIGNPSHLHLKFHDIDGPRPGWQCPRLTHVRQIIDAAPSILSHKTVFSHCYSGVSRSTAAAILLHYLHTKDAEKAVQEVLRAKPSCLPNRLLLSYADELLGTNLEELASNHFEYEL